MPSTVASLLPPESVHDAGGAEADGGSVEGRHMEGRGGRGGGGRGTGREGREASSGGGGTSATTRGEGGSTWGRPEAAGEGGGTETSSQPKLSLYCTTLYPLRSDSHLPALMVALPAQIQHVSKLFGILAGQGLQCN